ncbi:3279_t:CDS:2 [Entrophospora sp. SA101]|nr:3279_t:CDS:2 [Entrophospora sp. SA101]CAJ0917556.1 15329_t:CDS:2 [Entrophospora sp. SA101]
MEEALTKPRNVTHTLYKLYNWLQMGIIDLNPEFQRAIKQSHLVDSVLNNFYVPPVIFSCKKLDNKRWIRVCIDGKQRLTAIKKFMDGEIPHVSPSDGNVAKRYYKIVNGKKSLTEPERELFDCSELLCVEYYDLSLQQEQEIFSRVQLGVALTPAEKLQAISSPMADFAHSIFSKYPSISLIMDTKRARPFQLITQSLHMIENEPEKFNATPAVITKFLKEERQVPSNLKIIAERIYQTLEAMIADNSDIFHKDNRLAPVEFVFLTYMIAKYPGLLISHYQSRLLAMKKHVRQKHDDIRFNNKVYDTLKRFVDGMESEYIVTSSTSTSSKSLASNGVLYKTESTNYGGQQSSSSRPKKRNSLSSNDFLAETSQAGPACRTSIRRDSISLANQYPILIYLAMNSIAIPTAAATTQSITIINPSSNSSTTITVTHIIFYISCAFNSHAKLAAEEDKEEIQLHLPDFMLKRNYVNRYLRELKRNSIKIKPVDKKQKLDDVVVPS